MTRLLRRGAMVFLVITMAAVAGAKWLAPQGYAAQHRDAILHPPSAQYWLGTDELGRDRFARLLYGARISLLLAPAAALAAVLLAALLGLCAAWFGGWLEAALRLLTNAILALPWLFLLIAVRAALPMNLDAHVSLAVTFALLALLGWAAPARVVANATAGMLQSDFVQRARAAGTSEWRILLCHLLPNLLPLLTAQFWVTAPAFLLSEANLGIIGLGIAPPAPSLGTLIVEVQSLESVMESPAKLGAPLLLILVAASCRLAARQPESTS
jgi:peptide/nickel transport system permease protein